MIYKVDNNTPQLVLDFLDLLKDNQDIKGTDIYEIRTKSDKGEYWLYLHNDEPYIEDLRFRNGIDVCLSDEECTIYSFYHHEHLYNLFQAAQLVLGIFEKRLVELIFKIDTFMSCGFYKNKNDNLENILTLNEDINKQMEYITNFYFEGSHSHYHVMYDKTAPFQLNYGYDTKFNVEGIYAYFGVFEFENIPIVNVIRKNSDYEKDN